MTPHERPFDGPRDGEFECIDCGADMRRKAQIDASHHLNCERCGSRLRLFRGPNDTTQWVWSNPRPSQDLPDAAPG